MRIKLTLPVAAAAKRVAYDAEAGLVLRPISIAQHFEARQGWKITDMLFNPMVRALHRPSLTSRLDTRPSTHFALIA